MAERILESPEADSPERHLDHVPRGVLADAYREIDIRVDPVEVAAARGVGSEELAALCRRGFIRVAETALPFTAAEAVKRMWDTLGFVDSPAVRRFPNHDRETYFRDKAAWEAVFFEHVQRQLPDDARPVGPTRHS